MGSLHKQIDLAKESLRKMKKTHPGMFQEFLNMIDAEERLAQAEEAYSRAKIEWDNLGEDNE